MGVLRRQKQPVAPRPPAVREMSAQTDTAASLLLTPTQESHHESAESVLPMIEELYERQEAHQKLSTAAQVEISCCVCQLLCSDLVLVIGISERTTEDTSNTTGRAIRLGDCWLYCTNAVCSLFGGSQTHVTHLLLYEYNYHLLLFSLGGGRWQRLTIKGKVQHY